MNTGAREKLVDRFTGLRASFASSNPGCVQEGKGRLRAEDLQVARASA